MWSTAWHGSSTKLCRPGMQAVPLLDGSRTAPLAAGLLYQLSMNDEARAAFCFCPGALSRLLDSILRALGPSNAGVCGILHAHLRAPSAHKSFEANLSCCLTGANTHRLSLIVDHLHAASAALRCMLLSAGPGSVSSSPGGLRTIPELIALAVNVAHSSGVAEVRTHTLSQTRVCCLVCCSCSAPQALCCMVWVVRQSVWAALLSITFPPAATAASHVVLLGAVGISQSDTS
jgi:hypothetical protein